MQIGKLREDGAFAIEAYCEQEQEWKSGRFETVSCAVVYADLDQPTHSIRLIQAQEQ